MVRLTAEQKEANKVATKERTQAFNVRRKAYREALDAAEEKARQSPEQAALEAANAARTAAFDARTAALADIDAQIAQLQERRRQLEAEHDVTIEAARTQTNAAWSAQQAVAKQLKGQVEAVFPDMVDVWYQSQWQRPDGV
jgi:chromosome segregation ATPase